MQLDSVRVLDLTRLLPGPYATQLLCDAGADIIKIEDTDSGDYARHMPPMTTRGVGSIFDAVNRGKKSVALDLKTDGGREAFYRLLDDADVVIESFRPGVTERLGIEYEAVHEQNPSVVYCSLSGYGQTGPLANHAGHDLNYIGRAGLLDMTREDENSPPVMPGYQVADMGGGLFAAFAIVGALCSRELGDGTGEYIDVGMTDVVLSFAQSLTADVFSEESPRPSETPLTGELPWYDIYETADGEYVTLAALEPQFWRTFCRAIDREDLCDKHMTSDPTERQALRAELDAVFCERTREEWVTAFDGVDATVDGVYTPNEAVESMQCRARGLIQDDDAPPRIGFPAVCELPASDESIPDHGEHTEELLRAANYDTMAIKRLRETGAIT